MCSCIHQKIRSGEYGNILNHHFPWYHWCSQYQHLCSRIDQNESWICIIRSKIRKRKIIFLYWKLWFWKKNWYRFKWWRKWNIISPIPCRSCWISNFFFWSRNKRDCYTPYCLINDTITITRGFTSKYTKKYDVDFIYDCFVEI